NSSRWLGSALPTILSTQERFLRGSISRLLLYWRRKRTRGLSGGSGHTRLSGCTVADFASFLPALAGCTAVANSTSTTGSKRAEKIRFFMAGPTPSSCLSCSYLPAACVLESACPVPACEC